MILEEKNLSHLLLKLPCTLPDPPCATQFRKDLMIGASNTSAWEFHRIIFPSYQNTQIRRKKNLLATVAKESTKATKTATTAGDERKEKRDLGEKEVSKAIMMKKKWEK